MHFTTATVAVILATVASASPLAELKPHSSGGVVQPISPDPVVGKALEGSITRRTPRGGIIQPI
jgi:hypothetical protein